MDKPNSSKKLNCVIPMIKGIRNEIKNNNYIKEFYNKESKSIFITLKDNK